MVHVPLGNADDTMDVVQDSILQLVKSYADRDVDDWRKLFYRILNNKINACLDGVNCSDILAAYYSGLRVRIRMSKKHPQTPLTKCPLQRVTLPSIFSESVRLFTFTYR